MLEFFRVVLNRYRLPALFCAGLTAVCILLAAPLAPELYAAQAQVLVVEPIAVHRLANPFAPVPALGKELADLPEILRSQERLVLLVKRTGLVDQWDAGRPWALKLKDRLMAALRGPVEEKDRIDALVAMLDRRTFVSVEGNKVRIGAQWSSPQLALSLAQNILGGLMQLRAEREGKTLKAAAEALDRQHESVRVDMAERAQRMESAGRLGRLAMEGEREQLLRDQTRAAELLVAAEEKHIASEIFMQSNALRFTVLEPPKLPKKPIGAGRLVRAAVGSLACLCAGAVCAAILALASGRLLSSAQVENTLGIKVLSAVRLGPSGVSVPLSRKGMLLAGALAVTTGAAVGFSKGDLLGSLLPPLAFVGGWLLWTRPLKWPLLVMFFLAVTLDDPTDRPYFNWWRSPLWSLGRIFYTNIALFTGFELATLGLAGLMVIRRLWFPREEAQRLDPYQGQAPRPLQAALIVSGLTVCFLVVMGVGRGGIFREALWQFRALLMMPIVASVAMYALEFPKDFPKLGFVLFAGSVVKALLGAYFIYFIANPSGASPPHTTGHNDTMILVTAMTTALALLWERPNRRHLVLVILWVPLVFLALKLNDRRIAYVDLALGLGLIYLLSPWHLMKRRLTQVGVALLPAVLLYATVGWNVRHGQFFAPVQKVRSIIAPPEDTEEESSNVERDIENFNLTKSWERNMFFGQGFGHAFTEFLPSNDFAQSAFGHIGHNSILWLLWIGGIFGFTGVLGYVAVGLFFLGRALSRTADWRERVGLCVALSIVVTYLMQAFGDMGTQAMMFDFFVGTAMAIAGRLATKTHAWRAHANPAADGLRAMPA